MELLTAFVLVQGVCNLVFFSANTFCGFIVELTVGLISIVFEFSFVYYIKLLRTFFSMNKKHSEIFCLPKPLQRASELCSALLSVIIGLHFESVEFYLI
jgi:hypothetical protein